MELSTGCRNPRGSSSAPTRVEPFGSVITFSTRTARRFQHASSLAAWLGLPAAALQEILELGYSGEGPQPIANHLNAEGMR